MVRVLTGLAAWLGGTTLAVSLTWFGAGTVIRNTTASPSLPVLSVAPARVSSPAPAPSSTPSRASGAAPGGRDPRPRTTTASPGAVASASPTADGSVRGYALTGGQVTLVVSQASAKLVTAVPAAGFSVQTWTGIDWLRVDFTSGPQVSSLIASWNGHAPAVTITN
jgi:hypothetical protein